METSVVIELPRCRRKKHVVYIATIEKANGLINSLIEQGRLLSLGLVVVDEVCQQFHRLLKTISYLLYTQLHMLGDGTVRGATLETCLAKVLHCSGEYTGEGELRLGGHGVVIVQCSEYQWLKPNCLIQHVF